MDSQSFRTGSPAASLLPGGSPARSLWVNISAPWYEIRARMRFPRFRTIDVSTGMGSPTARGPIHTCLSLFVWDDVAFSSPERDRHLGKASFAAQYPAHGLPCERFTSALANCRADSGPERLARPYSVADFRLLILCQLILALLRFVLRSARQRLRSLGERWSK